jgi:hypothetical protein
MSESERILKLNELFFDYVAYLIYMARQILTPGGYDHFALIKALEKVLEIQQMSGEIKGIEVFNDIRIELKTVESTSSSEYETWKPFLDKLVQIIA